MVVDLQEEKRSKLFVGGGVVSVRAFARPGSCDHHFAAAARKHGWWGQDVGAGLAVADSPEVVDFLFTLADGTMWLLHPRRDFRKSNLAQWTDLEDNARVPDAGVGGSDGPGTYKRCTKHLYTEDAFRPQAAVAAKQPSPLLPAVAAQPAPPPPPAMLPPPAVAAVRAVKPPPPQVLADLAAQQWPPPPPGIQLQTPAKAKAPAPSPPKAAVQVAPAAAAASSAKTAVAVESSAAVAPAVADTLDEMD